MDSVLRDILFLFVYLDHILVASASADDHLTHSVPRPRTVKSLQGFLGMVNFYNRFLPHGAQLMRPLYNALRGRRPANVLDWSAGDDGCIRCCQNALTNAALLAHPTPTAPVALTTDASDYTVGAVCEQSVGGAWQPHGACWLEA